MNDQSSLEFYYEPRPDLSLLFVIAVEALVAIAAFFLVRRFKNARKP
jgi:hypothetical protein